MSGERDLVGYGATPPDAQWPGGARVAVQFVVNYEEGAENSVLNGDAGSEAFLSEMVGAPSCAESTGDVDGTTTAPATAVPLWLPVRSRRLRDSARRSPWTTWPGSAPM